MSKFIIQRTLWRAQRNNKWNKWSWEKCGEMADAVIESAALLNKQIIDRE